MPTNLRQIGYSAEGTQLDETNLRLLAELQDDARLSLAELGRRVGLSSPAVAERLQRIREIVVARVSETTPEPEQKIRYNIAAVMLGGRYALHFAGWKKHIGIYPVPMLSDAIEAQLSPYRAEKDSLVFPHSAPIPYALIDTVAAEIVALRTAGKWDLDGSQLVIRSQNGELRFDRAL